MRATQGLPQDNVAARAIKVTKTPSGARLAKVRDRGCCDDRADLKDEFLAEAGRYEAIDLLIVWALCSATAFSNAAVAASRSVPL